MTHYDDKVEAAFIALRSIVDDQAIPREGFHDLEADHCEADEILCTLLSDLGCEKVVAEWRKIRKWYA